MHGQGLFGSVPTPRSAATGKFGTIHAMHEKRLKAAKLASVPTGHRYSFVPQEVS